MTTTTTTQDALVRLRVQIKGLACAAATDCLRDSLARPAGHGRGRADHLQQLDRLAEELARPGLEALAAIEQALGDRQPTPLTGEGRTQQEAFKAHEIA